jgi:hypothetical protein
MRASDLASLRMSPPREWLSRDITAGLVPVFA